MEDIIYWAKVKEQAVLPQKRDEDAGYDVYACFEEDYRIIAPHSVCMVPLGIASAFPSDYVVLLKERGSTGVKNIAQRSGVIDSGFRGEYMCPISNLNDQVNLAIIKSHVDPNELPPSPYPYICYPYEKAVAQAIILRRPKLLSQEITYEELLMMKSQRMQGKLGSSGK